MNRKLTAATMAVIDGRLKAGLTEAELLRMCEAKGVRKVSRRDLPVVVAEKATGPVELAVFVCVHATVDPERTSRRTVADVADVLAQIAARRLAGTWHWSGTEPLTKFDMATVTARLAGVDPARLVRSGAPANGSEPRPKDCHLDRSALERLGVTAKGRLFEPTVRGLLPRFA